MSNVSRNLIPLVKKTRAVQRVKNKQDHQINGLEIAVRAACYDEATTTTKQPDAMIPDTPLILLSLNEDALVSRLAYWPLNVEIGLRLMNALEGPNQCRLLDCLWAFVNNGAYCELDDARKFLCKQLDVKTIEELGLWRQVIEERQAFPQGEEDVAEECFDLNELSPQLFTRVYHQYT